MTVVISPVGWSKGTRGSSVLRRGEGGVTCRGGQPPGLDRAPLLTGPGNDEGTAPGGRTRSARAVAACLTNRFLHVRGSCLRFSLMSSITSRGLAAESSGPRRVEERPGFRQSPARSYTRCPYGHCSLRAVSMKSCSGSFRLSSPPPRATAPSLGRCVAG